MKLQLKTAVKNDRSEFDVSSRHTTTMDFGTITPVYCLECIPSDSLKLNMYEFARLSPLPVPTFGQIHVHTRAFFVPMRSIWLGFKDYISRSNDASLATTFPTITNVEMQNWFWDDGTRPYGLSVPVTSSDSYDFSVDSNYYRFTSSGRWLYKILLSLGYSINFGYSSVTSAGENPIDTTDFSLLPLLAFMRILYDYVYPSDYVNGIGLGSLFEDRTNITESNVIAKILPLLFTPFSQDYFTSAWRNLNRHGTSDNVVLYITDPMNTSGLIQSSVDRTFAPTNGSKITSMGLRILDAVTNFVTRNNIAGSRYFEQLRARFGISSINADPDRSMFIKSFSDDVTIQDVTALSATTEAELGELAGKGYLVQGDNINHELSFDVDTYGYFMVLSHIEPETFYYQGRKRHTLHIDPLDFYTPEFDNIGLQPIRHDELFADDKNKVDFALSIAPSQVFGFAPRYAEYKKGDDYLTGDFRVNSANSGLDSYHLGRIVNGRTILDADFCAIKQHEFDRIFSNPSQLVAPFSWKEITWYARPSGGGSYATTTSFLCYDDKPISIVCKHSGQGNTMYCNGCIIKSADDKVTMEFWNTTSDPNIYFPTSYIKGLTASEVFDVTAYDNSLTGDTIATVGMTTPASLRIVLGDRNFYISIPETGVNVSPIHTYLSNKDLSPDEFLEFWRQYFDHFIFRYTFKVTAYRKMLTISESMPITDGGAPQSVDAYGTHLNM